MDVGVSHQITPPLMLETPFSRSRFLQVFQKRPPFQKATAGKGGVSVRTSLKPRLPEPRKPVSGRTLKILTCVAPCRFASRMAALEVDISRNTLGGAGGKASTARVRALERCAVVRSWRRCLGLESNVQFEVTFMHMLQLGMAHAFISSKSHQCSDTFQRRLHNDVRTIHMGEL